MAGKSVRMGHLIIKSADGGRSLRALQHAELGRPFSKDVRGHSAKQHFCIMMES
jgi:hypothetical protein